MKGNEKQVKEQDKFKATQKVFSGCPYRAIENLGVAWQNQKP